MSGFDSPLVVGSASTYVGAPNIDTKIQCQGESYNALIFFFFVSGQPSSVNDVQGIILHKPTKIKLLRATKLRRRASHYGDYIETF